MENVNQEELRQWVVKQTAYLDPPAGWRPDSAAALTRFHARIETDRPSATRRRWLLWTAAAALIAMIVLLLPGGAWWLSNFGSF